MMVRARRGSNHFLGLNKKLAYNVPKKNTARRVIVWLYFLHFNASSCIGECPNFSIGIGSM